MPKTLILWRHAKAIEATDGMNDHDRPLSERGHGHAQHMADYMREQDMVPDYVLCSTSARTRQTLAAMQPVPPTQLENALYLASAGMLISQIQSCDDAVNRLMVIGHNPGLHQLALTLAATAKHQNEYALLQLKLPTSAVVVLDLAVQHWQDIAPLSCVLRHMATPELLGVK